MRQPSALTKKADYCIKQQRRQQWREGQLEVGKNTFYRNGAHVTRQSPLEWTRNNSYDQTNKAIRRSSGVTLMRISIHTSSYCHDPRVIPRAVVYYVTRSGKRRAMRWKRRGTLHAERKVGHVYFVSYTAYFSSWERSVHTWQRKHFQVKICLSLSLKRCTHF